MKRYDLIWSFVGLLLILFFVLIGEYFWAGFIAFIIVMWFLVGTEEKL